jgi:hypothetical protein
MAYVYRHIRKDTNQPFYIGVGLTDDNYHRAGVKSKRNKYWKNIVAITEYDIHILFDNISDELAFKKEIEFISIYKRIEDGGTLCNMTLGGEGTKGITPVNSRVVYGKRKDGKIIKFKSMAEAEIKTGCYCLSYLIKNKSVTRSGWFFSYTKNGLNQSPRTSNVGKHLNHRKKEITITNGTETKTFKSYSEASRYIGSYPNSIGDLVRNINKQTKGWRLAKKN